MGKRIAILGSTGSIGRQALEVIDQLPPDYTLELITARNNYKLLIDQALKYQPNVVVITDPEYYVEVNDVLSDEGIKVYAGDEALLQVLEMDTIDLVLVSIVGFAGLVPTLTAIENGKDIALANKEALVVAGDLVMKKAKENGVRIYPVDSEHSAIFQCLAGEYYNSIEKIYLTASGGPFRGMVMSELKNARKNEALKHPNWEMGDKITIDSATLINKGLEVIEARWLFDLMPDQIEVIIHPQSIIHSIVQFKDGSMKAQMGLPDMKLPIHYALTYPYRLSTSFPRFSFDNFAQLTFEAPDLKKFRNLALAFESLQKGGNLPCILNAANEVVVNAYLEERIGFFEMSDVIEMCMNRIHFIQNPGLEDYLQTDNETRGFALSAVNKF